ncbi:MAG: S24/S26 family peptidase [Bacteroidales bacterium]|nr:S24/S26 family peptidase [Bacteroidales bacterium]
MGEKLTIPNSLFFAEVESHLSEGRSVVIPVKGYSMLPFIRDGRDSVELVRCEGLKVGDIALAKLGNGHFVLHRVWEIDGEKVVLMGDGNIAGKEICRCTDIIGIASKIFRGKRVIDCTSAPYLRNVKIWRKLLPIRRYILAIYRRLIKLGL